MLSIRSPAAWRFSSCLRIISNSNSDQFAGGMQPRHNNRSHLCKERGVNNVRHQSDIASQFDFDDENKTSVLMELTDKVGVLHDVLRYFWKHEVNISRLESRPATRTVSAERKFDFFVDFDGRRGTKNVDALFNDLKPITDKLLILDNKKVHYFPRHISELDNIANRTLGCDTGDLEADHPGFHGKHLAN